MARRRLALAIAVPLAASTLALALAVGVCFVDVSFPHLKLPLSRAGIVGDERELEARLTEAKLERAERELRKLQKDLDDLRVSYADTRRSLKEKEIVLATMEERGWNVLSRGGRGRDVPAIDAKVVAVDDSVPPRVVLSVGAEDKVEEGFQFSVYRGSEFVGKVRVERVGRESSTGRVLFTKEDARISAGDSAATRLD
ncbi:hypothetical protein HY251_13410 [bacterium]|nr:hypothetical protein [bacterium]